MPRYEAAVAADPSMPESRNNLGAALWRRGDLPRAERELREALRLRPGYAEAYFNLGHLAIRDRRRRRRGRATSARRPPRKPEWVLAQTTAAWVLSTAADRRVRAPAEAVELRRARRRPHRASRRRRRSTCWPWPWPRPAASTTPSATAREALALAAPPLATAIAARLALFERGEAFVDGKQ